MTKERFNKIVKYGSFAVVSLLVAPIIFLMIQGAIGIGIAIALAAITNALIPAFSEWLTQLKFGALRAVISRAPVDTLIQRGKERTEALQEQSELLQTQAASLQAFKRKVLHVSKTYPEEAVNMQQTLDGYEQLFAYRVQAFKDAKDATAAYMRTIDKAEAMYEVAKADEALGQSFGKQKDFMAAFREKTAFDAIDQANDRALANLKMALIDDEYASKVEAPAHAIKYDANQQVMLGNILDVKAVEVPR